MPQMTNGIGTWYWGKANRFEREDFCEHCGRYCAQHSYDTTKFVVFLYLPFIPLGKKRIFDECSACSMHRAIPLKDWRKGSDEALPEANQTWQRDRANIDAAEMVLATIVAIQDEPQLDSFLADLGSIGQDNAAFLGRLGAVQEYFGRLSDAEQSYRKSLETEYTPAANDALALVLVKQAQPENAWPLLERMIEEKREGGAAALLLTAERFQEVGRHDNALYVIQEAVKLYPELEKDRAYKRIKKTSEKHIESGKKVTADTFKSVKKVDVTGNRVFAGAARFVIPAVFLLVLILYFWASHNAGKNREVIVVNGLPIGYDVRIDDRKVSLRPKQRTRITIPEGEHQITVLGDSLDIPDATCTIETDFLTRVFVDHTFIINPDLTAIILWEEAEYSEHPDPNAEQAYEFRVGEPLIHYEGIDYLFTEFPDEIELPGGDNVTKQRVSHLSDLGPEWAILLIKEEVGLEAAAEFALHQPLRSPTEEMVLPYYASLAQAEKVVPLIQPLLDDRPARVEAHRFYQTMIAIEDPDYDVIAEYRALLDANPRDPDLCYLLARLIEDPTERDALIERALKADPDHARAIGAQAYNHMIGGDFDKSLEAVRRAMKLAPNTRSFETYEVESLHGLSRLEELLENVRAASDGDPNSQDTEFVIYLLSRLGRSDEARKQIDSMMKQAGDSIEAEKKAQIRHRLDGILAYLDGDIPAYVRSARAIETTGADFVAHVCENDLVAAREIIESIPADIEMWALLPYIQAATQGDDPETAQTMLEAATTFLAEKQDPMQRVANWLTASENPNPAEVLAFDAMPAQKRVALVAMGLRFPADREAYFATAQKLNCDHRFPHHIIKEALEGE